MSLVALIVSVGSLWAAIRSCSISNKAIDLAVDPIVRVRFDIKPPFTSHAVIVANQGLNAVIDLRIRRIIRLIAIDARVLSSLKSKHDWAHSKTLAPGDTVHFTIPPDDVDRSLWGIPKYFTKTPIGSAITFLVAFRREMDKKEFRVLKTLFFVRDSESGKPIPFDPDEHGSEDWRERSRKLHKLDEDWDF